MNAPHFLKIFGLALLCIGTLTCCDTGGGGGGDESDVFIGAAEVSVRTSPTKIDTGDRTEVTIDISEVHDNGIILKIRYPKGLKYVPSSAFLTLDNLPSDIDPHKNLTKENTTYLVFILSRAQFGTEARGTVTFELTGNFAVTEGLVEVDADVDDPLIKDNKEFDIEQPEFGTESEASIEVI